VILYSDYVTVKYGGEGEIDVEGPFFRMQQDCVSAQKMAEDEVSEL